MIPAGALIFFIVQQMLNHWSSLWTLAALEAAVRGVVSVVATLATFYGLTLTLIAVWKLQKTIKGFPKLIRKVCKMSNEATSQEPIRILAYTPALGYLAEPDEWFRLFNALTTLTDDGKHRTKIICLKKEDLDVWHRQFVGRTTSRERITLERAENATQAAKNLLEALSKDSEGNDTKNATVIELPWHFMPGFYLFITKKRALVVTPLFLPFPKGVPYQENLPQVEIIGIEYRDDKTIRDLKQIYQFYADLPQSSLGEASSTIKLKDLESWLNGSASTDITQRLLQEFSDSYEKTKVGYASPLALSDGEVELVLRANVKTWGDGLGTGDTFQVRSRVGADEIDRNN
jgi:hypothetical protein